MVVQGWESAGRTGDGRRRVTADRYEVSFGVDKHVLALFYGDSCTLLIVLKTTLHCTLYVGELYGM